MGARLFAPGSRSTRVGCIVMAGRDFPEVVLRQIKRWGLNTVVHEMPDRPSTRGLLQYTDSDFGRRSAVQHQPLPRLTRQLTNAMTGKTFAYLTQPLQPYPSILQYPHLIGSKVFHFLAKPDDTEKQAQAILEARRPLGLHERPRIIWEPAPLSCEFENRDAHLRACRFVDVFSPNHIELRKIMQPEYGRDCQIVTDFDRSVLEAYAETILDHGIGPDSEGAAIIRCGEYGCLAFSRSYGPRWFPTYHDPASSRVVDPTGAGNAFLGGFAIAFEETNDLTEAVMHGTVSASFAMEQIGLPTQGEFDEHETWNGVQVAERLDEYRKRLEVLDTLS